jgi:hypothetical protein
MEVKVSQASDFGTMVDRFPIDVQYQLAERVVGVRPFGRAAGA